MSGNIILHYFNSQILFHLWINIVYLTFYVLRINSLSRIDDSNNNYFILLIFINSTRKFLSICIFICNELKYWLAMSLIILGVFFSLLSAIIKTKYLIFLNSISNFKNYITLDLMYLYLCISVLPFSIYLPLHG